MDESLCKTLMISIQNFCTAADILVLSTCNRTEIYYSSEKDYSKEIILLLGIQKGLPDMTEYYVFFNILNKHKESVQHLFEVSIGLDSQVVGDAQISNQVKQAYQWSADISMAGPFLHRLMHTIFFTHKKVVQTTSFRDGTASVSYAALELVESLWSTVGEPKILIVGLGEMGLDVCRHFAKSSFKKITITNRTISKADDFLRYDAITIIPFDDLWQAVQEADVIISSVSIPEPLFTIERISKLDIFSYKYFIDLSVPRSVESSIEDKAGIITYNIDDLQIKTTKALEKRMAAIPYVQQIIAESVHELEDWTKEMEVSPVINKFKDTLEQIRQKELSRHLKNLNAAESEKIELITRNIMQKIVKLPVLQLKAACKRGEPGTLIDVLHELFDLKDVSENNVNGHI